MRREKIDGTFDVHGQLKSPIRGATATKPWRIPETVAVWRQQNVVKSRHLLV